MALTTHSYLKRFAFDLRDQLKAKRAQRINVAPRFATICDSGLSRNALYAVLGLGLLLADTPLLHAQTHSHGGGHGHGHQHDERTMPGLRGEDASAEESAELALLFRRFETLSREVENLPNGIRTVTRSSEPTVMDALVSHAVGMIDRVHAKDDPKIIIQSPTLDAFFLFGDEIASDVSMEDEGLVVIQTSNNPELVAALHLHAAEVTAMVERGMAAVHDMMMDQGRGH